MHIDLVRFQADEARQRQPARAGCDLVCRPRSGNGHASQGGGKRPKRFGPSAVWATLDGGDMGLLGGAPGHRRVGRSTVTSWLLPSPRLPDPMGRADGDPGKLGRRSVGVDGLEGCPQPLIEVGRHDLGVVLRQRRSALES